MSKPFKRPLKNQVWRLISTGDNSKRIAELIPNVEDSIAIYVIRYIRTLKPIILANLDGLTIEGLGNVTECEIDTILHPDILQRAVELAKAAWVSSNSNDNI